MGTSPTMSAQNHRSFCRELRNAIGADKVKDEDIVLTTYSYDPSPAPGHKPGFVVLPEGREDVIATLKLANKYRIPVTVMAGGVSVAGYSIPAEGGIVLDMRRMDRIIEINTDSGYAVVEAGCRFDKLTAALREKGFRTLVPTAPGSASPVGNSLSRPTTNLCNRHLDGIVDLEVVLPDGTEFRTGSSHFPNAGSSLRYGPFADLAGLYTCGYGTMGIVTRAALRIQTINEANRINVAAFNSYGDALDFVKEIINHNIPEHCIIWNWQLYDAFAADTSSGAGIPAHLKGDPRTPPEGLSYCLVTTFLSGYEEIMVADEKVLTRVARKHRGRTIAGDEARKRFPIAILGWDELYARYHQIEPTFFGLGKYMVWTMITEPKDVKEMEKYAVEQLAKVGVAPVCYYSHPFDYGRSIFFRIFVFPDPTDEEMIGKVGAKFDEMFTTAMERYGAIPMSHQSFMPGIHLTGGFYEVLGRIKKSLDPNHILNPGMGIFPEDE